jgi:long-chain acyl-CoA synthetase
MMHKPWLESYPEGMPAHIDVRGYDSLVDLLDQACKKYADRVACVSFDVSMTYAELDRHALSFAKWLQSLNLPPGFRVALMMPNVPAYLIALLGTLRAGGVAVNVNPLYTPRELQLQLKDSGASVIVVFETFAHVLEKTQACDALKHRVVVAPGDMLGVVKGPVVSLIAKHVKKIVPPWHLSGALRWKAVLRCAQQLPWNPPALGLNDLAVLQYTGGTTGSPKGAMLTHGNLVANVLQIHQVALPALRHVITGPLTMLAALPLYHVFAMTVCALYGIHTGMKNLLVINPRDRKAIVQIWRKHPVNIFPGVNTLFNALALEPAFARLDFSALKLVFGGGMALQSAVADQWLAVTGLPLIEGYGLSECSPVVAANPTNAKIFSGSVGLALPSTEIAIFDADGHAVAPGVHGEIAVRGPQVMSGYWNAASETSQALRPDGFFLTGDIGWMDEKGFVFIADRKKDMILVSGFNVYPSEIESVVTDHEGVVECAAIGIPDEHSGESVKLFVVKKSPELTEHDLKEWCMLQLARYKCPRTIVFCEDLPKSNVGKVLRRSLRNDE